MDSSKVKICVDARLLTKSGIGRYLREILIPLSKEFDLICLVDNSGVPFMQLNAINYKLCDAKIYSVKEQFLLPKLIPKCDLFWSPHFNIPLLPIKAKKRLVTIHDAFHLAFAKSLSLFENIYAKIFFSSALLLSDEVITVSEFSKSELLKYTSKKFEKKIHVILNGVTKFEPKLQSTYFVKSGNYFLYVGNIKPHKNLKNAILGFKAFCEKNPDTNFTFKIVGQKEGFVNADNEVISLLSNDVILREKVQFTGYIEDDDLVILYSSAYCLVFPSLYEGFGLPPLESMALGIPAIVSKVASMPELCENAVIYFNPLDINDIYAAMENIVSNKRLYESLIKEGLEIVRKFDWSVSSMQHISLINKIIY
jgi:glycosyltransferase involved in cell wall biosynthesis